MSIWNWLKDGDNQRTLKFIGGGIAVALAVIVQTELSRKQDDAARRTASATSAAPAGPVPATPSPTGAPPVPAASAPPAIATTAQAPAIAPAPIVQVVTGSGAKASAVQGNNIQINIHDDKH